MNDPAILLRDARTEAGLSRKALARRAGVPTSTVTRVENGDVDPTTTMLRRLLAAGNCTLELDTGAVARTSLAALSDAIHIADTSTIIDWTRLRAFIDTMTQHPRRVGQAIATPPPRSGSEVLDNLLAAIAETLADQHDIARPRWCATVEPLERSCEPPGTPRMRDRGRRNTPPAFAVRNIVLDRSQLWRQRD